jgi:hypothetical protein
MYGAEVLIAGIVISILIAFVFSRTLRRRATR